MNIILVCRHLHSKTARIRRQRRQDRLEREAMYCTTHILFLSNKLCTLSKKCIMKKREQYTHFHFFSPSPRQFRRSKSNPSLQTNSLPNFLRHLLHDLHGSTAPLVQNTMLQLLQLCFVPSAHPEYFRNICTSWY